MKRYLFLIPLILLLSGCGQDLRFWGSHTISSAFGLNRTVNVYAPNGALIESYNVRSKVERYGDGSISFFDNKDKRVDISGFVGIVVKEQ